MEYWDFVSLVLIFLFLIFLLFGFYYLIKFFCRKEKKLLFKSLCFLFLYPLFLQIVALVCSPQERLSHPFEPFFITNCGYYSGNSIVNMVLEKKKDCVCSGWKYNKGNSIYCMGFVTDRFCYQDGCMPIL